MFIPWRINIVKISVTQSHLQIQWNPYQDISGIFIKIEKSNQTICMKPQNT